MEDLALQPAALDFLEIATTATGPTDPKYHLFKEWCAMSSEDRSEALLSIEINGVMYVNTDLDLQVVSIINPPADRLQRKEWCIGQVGTRLSRGAEPVRFNRDAVCGDVVVPMRVPYAEALGLFYDTSKSITATTCKLWDDFDPAKDFPGDGELRMTAFPRGFPFGQGAVVPQSFEEMLDLIESDNPTILNGTPAPGLADAMRALEKNEYHSFFGKPTTKTPNLYGMEKSLSIMISVRKRKNQLSTTT